MIVIRMMKTREDCKAYYALRYHVLREPFNQQKGTEKDDYEPISQHFMAVDEKSGEIVGVVKLFEKGPGVGQFSHMAVAPLYQRQGIGHKLMGAIEAAALEKDYDVLGLMSRLNSTKFFEKYGYRVVGLPSYYFGTIQLVWMEKNLNISP